MICALCAPISAVADPADCTKRDWEPEQRTDVRTPVYIDRATFNLLKNHNGVAGVFTYDEIIGVVNQAMEQWNHSAAGREFYYAGFEQIPRKPNGTEDPDSSAWCGKGFVVGEELEDGSRNITRCVDPQTNIGTGFKIRLTTRRSGYAKHWVMGDPVGINFTTTHQPGPQQYRYKNMVAILTHEFGHSLNIGHPPDNNSNNGVVRGLMGSTLRSDLYQNDIECAEVYYDSAWRLLTLRQTSFTSGSFSSSVYAYGTSSTGGVSAGGANKTPDQFRGSYFQGIWSPWTAMYVDRYTSGSLSLGSSHFLPIAPLRIHRRELAPVLRDALILMPRASTSYGDMEFERWTRRVYQSTTGFDGGIDSNLPLVECTTPTSGCMTGCSNHKSVVTLRRPVSGYDDFRNRSVVAWTHLNRAHPAVAANHDMRVSWGFYDGSLSNAPVLAPSTSLGVRSDVSPGLACKHNQAGQNSTCMLAYTDIADPANRIKFRRFSGQSNSQYYYPVVEGQDQTIDSAQWHRTTSPIALFYHNSRWWVVFKLALATGSGSLRVYSSTNGLTNTWTYHGTLGYSATGANAIGDWMVSNRVHWAN